MSDIDSSKQSLSIGVFDSGMGGLTVLSALKESLPNESFVYLGDTARLPYGTKSCDTVVKYAIQMVEILIKRGIKLLVIACNTATTAAIDALKMLHPKLPIIGVIAPGVQAAIKATQNNNILLLATETTVRSGGYKNLIKQHDTSIEVNSLACGLFVALAEEGFVEGNVAKTVIDAYLSHVNILNYDCLLLGCTHFPVFKTLIQAYVGDKVRVVDSAIETAKSVYELMEEKHLFSEHVLSKTQYLVTDLPERFARVGELFLNSPINFNDIELVE